ncbi:hypothetical protein ACFXKG_05165 [Streptomyces sp. NPDC059255]|uniref:hypothetical protein n=1 Tax=Streptomyces sp. NPDC059255 TaxID=3346793 RepID=UPI0036CBF8AA
MAVRQLPVEIGTFARYLKDLTTLLDPGAGWYGVFLHRDPEGLRACLGGAEIPPWDVVESLLQDFAAGRDTQPVDAAAETERARRLHTVSALAYDRLPGNGAALAERLRLMDRERTAAAGRAEELVRLLRTTPEGAPGERQLTHDLAWVRDDLARATARCAELRSRIAALPEPAADPGADTGTGRGTGNGLGTDADPGAGPGAGAGAETGADPGAYGREPAARGDASGRTERGRTRWGGRRRTGGTAPGPGTAGESAGPGTAARRAEPPQKKRKPRGARFAGLDVDEAYDTYETYEAGDAYGAHEAGAAGEAYAADGARRAEEPPPAPVLPAPPPAAPATPRGARFGGAPGAAPRTASAGPGASPSPSPSPEDRRAAHRIVGALRRLRAEGRTGEAHVVLCEAAGSPPEQLPLLAAELHRAGLGADWAELLWEAAFLPPAQLAAAAGALAAAGRDDDCGQLLRQGVSRPAGEITDAVLALDDAGRAPEARALLSAFVQARPPADAALVAAPDPRRLVPRLLDAARAVSASRERDVVHALRVAGIAAG